VILGLWLGVFFGFSSLELGFSNVGLGVNIKVLIQKFGVRVYV
jgi:hypothetical protein